MIEKLDRPVAPDANVELTTAALEAERLRLQKEAKLVMETRLAFDRDLREYNAANGITEGFTPVVNPRRRAELRDRGKDLNVEMDRAAESSTGKSASRKSGTGKPVYSSPAKNLRAAAAAKAELSHLRCYGTFRGFLLGCLGFLRDGEYMGGRARSVDARGPHTLPRRGQ